MSRLARVNARLVSWFLVVITALLLSTCIRPSTPAYAGEPFPEGCAVVGIVFSQGQVFALLHSNCPVTVTRKNSLIMFVSPNFVVTVEIPEGLPKTPFYYLWGSSFALFGDGRNQTEWKPVHVAPRRGA